MQTEVVSGIKLGVATRASLLAFGAPWDALAVSLGAATFVSFWLPSIDSKPRALFAVLFAGLAGTYSSPVLAELFISKVAAVDFDAIRLLMALAVAAAAPTLVPVLLRRAVKKWEK